LKKKNCTETPLNGFQIPAVIFLKNVQIGFLLSRWEALFCNIGHLGNITSRTSICGPGDVIIYVHLFIKNAENHTRSFGNLLSGLVYGGKGRGRSKKPSELSLLFPCSVAVTLFFDCLFYSAQRSIYCLFHSLFSIAFEV